MLEQRSPALSVLILQNFYEKITLVWILWDSKHNVSVFPLTLPNMKKQVKKKKKKHHLLSYINLYIVILQNSTKTSQLGLNFL